MFWYLSIAIATKLPNMAVEHVFEKNAIALHWMSVIPIAGMANITMMERRESGRGVPPRTNA